MVDILFVNATSNLDIREEVNGTMLLATKLMQAGFSTKILRFGQFESCNVDYSAFIKEISSEILNISPQCVSFYALWPQYHTMLRIASKVKESRPDISIVFGGPQATATSRDTMEAMPFVDYVCTGEGEETVVPFFDAIFKQADLSHIPGLYYRKDGCVVCNDFLAPLCDLNDLPHWDERLYVDDYKKAGVSVDPNTLYMPIDAGRGCPYSCTFCCTSHFWRRTYRLKSAQTIVNDILYYRNKYGIKSFWFSHDAFTVDKELVSQVCDGIVAAGLNDISWKCTSRIDCITEDLINKMQQAGLKAIELGIETGSPRMQKLINKNLNLEKANEIIEMLLKNKLHVGLFFMYGFPEETEDDLNKTLEMIFSLLDKGVQHVSMSFCRFNPKTAITEKYFDDLVFDSQIQILLRTGFFGHDEEIEMIRENKALFPFFFHLDTPVRNGFQFLSAFVLLYQKLCKVMKRVRVYYQGDNLAFYKDFVRTNQHIFEQGYGQISKNLRFQFYEMVDNLICFLNVPETKQLRALAEFEADCVKISTEKEDALIRKTYNFSYIDFKLELPIKDFSDGKTEILLEKKNGKVDMKVLRIE